MKLIYLVTSVVIIMISQNINGQEQPGRVKQSILKAVVQIIGPQNENGEGYTGTGFLVSKEIKRDDKSFRKVFIVTNKHIIGDWNIADGNIANYSNEISVYFYKTMQVSGNSYELVNIILKDRIEDKIIIHPNPNVDIALISIDEEIEKIADVDLLSFDETYLTHFDKVVLTHTGLGDQVFAIGYPLGIKSLKNNYPIAKSGYLSSFPGTEMAVNMNVKNRENEEKVVNLAGKIFLVDGLIVGGNSGSPVILPSEIKSRINPETKNLEWTKAETENLIIGIVSSGWSSAGLAILYSSDYIIELLNNIK